MTTLAQLRAGPPIALASRSPQRRALLRAAGIPFDVVESAYEERDLPGLGGAAVAAAHARGKAEGARVPAGVAVVGVDTVVEVDGRALGKPSGRSEAREFLEMLSGRTHAVHSAVHAVCDAQTHSACETTAVTFADLGPEDLDWYLDTEEWRDRAGGYAIQERGAALVTSVQGDYLNVVGLPLRSMLHAVLAVRG